MMKETGLLRLIVGHRCGTPQASTLRRTSFAPIESVACSSTLAEGSVGHDCNISGLLMRTQNQGFKFRLTAARIRTVDTQLVAYATIRLMLTHILRSQIIQDLGECEIPLLCVDLRILSLPGAAQPGMEPDLNREPVPRVCESNEPLQLGQRSGTEGY